MLSRMLTNVNIVANKNNNCYLLLIQYKTNIMVHVCFLISTKVEKKNYIKKKLIYNLYLIIYLAIIIILANKCILKYKYHEI